MGLQLQCSAARRLRSRRTIVTGQHADQQRRPRRENKKKRVRDKTEQRFVFEFLLLDHF